VTATSRPPARTDTQRPAVNRKHTSKRPAGETQAYREGCRCYPCCSAWAAYREEQQHADWKPFVDAQPIREHLAYLAANGIGLMRVAEIVGVHMSTLQRMRGRVGKRDANQRVRTELAAAILAIQPDLRTIDTATDGGFIDATGTHRRTQALIALGFPATYIAGRIGMSPNHFSEFMRRPQVTAENARAIRSLYDELAMKNPAAYGIVPGSITRARRMAEANGWALPLEWDDDWIDDPGAQPYWARRTDGGDERPVTEAEAADVAFVLHTTRIKEGEAVKDYRERVAKRLEIDPKRLEYIITRKLPKLEQAARRDRDEMAVAA
jgi:hypothetical protein